MGSVIDRRIPAGGRTPPTPLAPPPTSAPSTSYGWRDPLLTGTVALVVYALHGYDGSLDRDLGVFTYGGLHVEHGVPPYVGIFNSVGPLADAVPGLAMWLGHFIGVDPILSARLFFTVLSALCCSLLCILARDTLGSRAAGFIAPAVFLTFAGFLDLASDGPREKTTMVVFLLGCLILLGRRRWAPAGACAALATLAWQPVLAVTLGALAAATLLDQQDTRRRILIRFTYGGLVPSLATVCYFLGAGALSRAIQGFIVINAEYTRQPSAVLHLVSTWTMLSRAYGRSLPVIIAGLVAILVIGVRAVPYARRPTVSTVARRLVVCAAGSLAGTVWTLMDINGGPDLFVLLPFAALGVAGAVVLLLGRRSRRVALTGTVAVVCLGVIGAGVESVTTRNDLLPLQRADVAAVLGTRPRDATIVSLSAPQVLALAGRDSPVPYQILDSNEERYLDGTYPGGVEGLFRTLAALRPTFVVVGRSFTSVWPDRWLATDYQRVGSGLGWTWYLARSAGPGALLQARNAHEEVMARYAR